MAPSSSSKKNGASRSPFYLFNSKTHTFGSLTILVLALISSQIVGSNAQDSNEDWDLDGDAEMAIEVDPQGNSRVQNPNEGMSVKFINKQDREVDVRWDDGVFGKVISHRLPKGENVVVNTFPGHIFVWTEHGTTRPLSYPVSIDPNQKEYKLTTAMVKKATKEMKCVDRFPKYCSQNAQQGECNVAPGWMIVHCPESCNKCELQDPKVRCARENLEMDPNPAWQPGDLNKMFERIMTDFPEFSPTALSSPPGPWVVRFDDFIKPDEVDRLIALNKKSFERSTDQGAVNEFGEMQKVISKSRTSSNSWCDHRCEADKLVSRVYQRIVNVTGVPRDNYESFQVLKYTKGQFYRTHHDDSGGDTSPAGPRILTFFLYLSDVEEGGETHFPRIDLSSKPKKGSAILWPSMSDDDPLRSDDRMYHQAKPVIKGVKFAANAWIHLYNYKVPNLWGCTGSFS
mmetsp:Transcript_9253/g.22739  ORF Transcript_9253/g.22739 Transcript_9253/m.22739 type:complete len:456 (-) Transcript_9253:227-1594(-)|eukprot:CAMPEP_0114506576 /NCGR_PEP_ID=MMETSP0109-20121206/11500_1 /TAXON_ID=29199 /ORGANISM="Chlorarachnion reptans, Strain CCCM449" /LENGTH=455 /DNA_ID=CAMNT_0001685171 /DNA_START=228 /DNA_END=1595 /DNA_ORIENTATION=-